MKITYDPRYNIAYIYLQEKTAQVETIQVSAEVCNNCGEYYLSAAVTEQILQRAEEAVNKGAEVEILRYAA